MNRKLHNTTMALIASSSLFVLGLLAGSPAPEQPATSVSDAASFDADKAMATAEAIDTGIDHADAVTHRQVRRPRQSVSMPFFSFAPRG